MQLTVLDRVQASMGESGPDVMVLSSPQNFTYVAGFAVPSHAVFPRRLTMLVVPPGDDPAIVTVDMEASTVRRATPGTELQIWRESTGDPMAILAALLSDMGFAAGEIGIEDDHMAYADLAKLKTALPKARFVSIGSRMSALRAVKTAEEIDLLRRLSRISDTAIRDAYGAVRAGSTELDIAAAMTHSVYAQGADDFKLMTVATGERSQLPNVGATRRRLAHGDVCRVKIFPVIRGYHAGVCRTAAVGERPAAAADIWAKLIECKYLILDMAAPGASGQAIYEAFAARLDKLGLPPIGFVGQGIGVHLHEEPYLGIGMDATLEPGMVLAIEPLVYETGHGFGLQNKDMVLITENGCELLSDITASDALLLVE